MIFNCVLLTKGEIFVLQFDSDYTYLVNYIVRSNPTQPENQDPTPTVVLHKIIFFIPLTIIYVNTQIVCSKLLQFNV